MKEMDQSVDFKFNKIYTEYSETTNIDQILQERVRDKKESLYINMIRTVKLFLEKVKRVFLYQMYGIYHI